MVKNLPDKWIRKAVYTAINDIVVNTFAIPCFDTRVPKNDKRSFYVIMSTQSNEVDKSIKCEHRWQSQILLDVITSYDINGNTGSRKMADDILDAIKTATDSLVLDVASGLTIVTQNQSFPNDLVSITENEIVYRKLMRIEFLIN
jgi:hypothetical protein